MTGRYDLLTEAEKALLCRLSVFAGGWMLSAAEGVCAGDGVEDFEVLDLLTGLVDKSLVVYEEGVDGQGRYRLLETVRQYAGDRLQEGGEAQEVQGRAASWFLGLAGEAAPQLGGPEAASWLVRLEAEHDNLRASLTWYEHTDEKSAAGAEAGPQDENGLRPENGLRLAWALWRFWDMHGHYSEGRQWLGRALARTQSGAAGEDGASVRAGSVASGISATRAKALNGAGALAVSQGDYVEARALHGESLAISRQLGDQQGIANALHNLGNVALNQGDYAAARALYEESLTTRRQLGDQQGIAMALNNLGFVALNQGDYAEARALQEESLTLYRQLGDQQGIAGLLGNLGLVAQWQGDYAAARALQEESLAISRRLGNQHGIADALHNLGFVALNQGNYAEARALHGESLALFRQLGNQQGIAYSLEGMAGVAQRQSQPSRTARLGGAAAALRESIGCPLSPAEQEEMDKQIAAGRTALGEEAFAAAWDAGRAMTPEQAVEYALAGANGDAEPSGTPSGPKPAAPS